METKQLKESEEYKKCKSQLSKAFEKLLINTSSNEIIYDMEKNILECKDAVS